MLLAGLCASAQLSLADPADAAQAAPSAQPTQATEPVQPAPSAQPAPVQPAQPGQCYALLVGGLAGSKPYDRWYADWLGRFQAYLTKSAAVPAANVTVLSGTGATSDAITGAIAKFAQRVKPQDQFILFITGHGEINEPAPRLILPGPDLSAPQLSAALEGLAAKNQVVLNLSASSGGFLRFLASPTRINLAATSPTETEEPVFAEFFLRGLESKRADTDHKGSITLLKAFNWAAQQTVLWIARWTDTGGGKVTDPKIWKASGKETVQIFEKLYPNIPERKLDPTCDRNAADAVVPLQPPSGTDIPKEWSGRRIISEHAMLEDCGKDLGVAVVGEKGVCEPIVGANPQDPGYLAAHTILGQATPLP